MLQLLHGDELSRGVLQRVQQLLHLAQQRHRVVRLLLRLLLLLLLVPCWRCWRCWRCGCCAGCSRDSSSKRRGSRGCGWLRLLALLLRGDCWRRRWGMAILTTHARTTSLWPRQHRCSCRRSRLCQ
jgi:hypothetical protein